jgi:hypothetical protein
VRFIADTRRRRNEIFILIEEVVMDRFIAQSEMRNVIFQTDNNNVIKIVKSTKKTVLNFSNTATCLVLFLQVVGVVRVYNFINLTVGGYPTTCYSNYSVESDRRDRIHQNVPKKTKWNSFWRKNRSNKTHLLCDGNGNIVIRCHQLKNKSSRRVTYGNPCYSIGSKPNSIYFLNDRSVYIPA